MKDLTRLRPAACERCRGDLLYDPFEDEHACLQCGGRVPLRPRVLLDKEPSRYDGGSGAVGRRPARHGVRL